MSILPGQRGWMSDTAKRPRPTRAKRKNNMTPEGRQRLSELAKQRHADGKLGGSHFGKLGGRGNTREKRLAQKAVAEAAGDHREEIIQVFRDAVDPEKGMGIRLQGAKLWLEAERENAKIALAEEKADGAQLGRDALIELLARKLSSGPAAAVMARQLEEEIIPDADVIEEDDGDGD